MNPVLQATLMVVHHEASVCQSMTELLNNEGYRVMSATTSVRALSLAVEARPDMILLDCVMPHLDGLAVLRGLRMEGHLGSVIVLAAHETLQAAREAMSLDAYDYIIDPINPELLKKIVREGLDSGG
jgi:two-component system nitrogen regulation response regulator GlnG